MGRHQKHRGQGRLVLLASRVVGPWPVRPPLGGPGLRRGRRDLADGTLVVGSGQTDIKQTATAAWKAENAQSRMDALLTST